MIDAYTDKFVNKILAITNDQEATVSREDIKLSLSLLVDKIYEDGFTDGVNNANLEDVATSDGGVVLG